MFPASILQGTYNQSSGSGGSGSFLSLPAPFSYMTKIGNNLYATTAAASGLVYMFQQTTEQTGV